MQREITFLLWFFGVGFIFLLLVVYGTIARNRWGINFDPTSVCPSCGANLPTYRRPKSLQQALWGGVTCSACGMEIDKWGRTLAKLQI
jgi:hypothetical protein